MIWMQEQRRKRRERIDEMLGSRVPLMGVIDEVSYSESGRLGARRVGNTNAGTNVARAGVAFINITADVTLILARVVRAAVVSVSRNHCGEDKHSNGADDGEGLHGGKLR